MVKFTGIKKRVVVHVTFIKLGEINTLKEAFEADVLVTSKWRESYLDRERGVNPDDVELAEYWNPKIFIENVIGEPKTTSSLHVEYLSNGEAFMVERKRFKGTFMEQMELWEFPFDMQDLSVTVMSDMPSSQAVLVERADEIHQVFRRSFIDEQEFYLYKYVRSEESELQKDKADPFARRSALVVGCKASRRPWCFVWNHFAITFLIACMAFLTFAVPANKPENRLQLVFTLVLTNVAFKFVITQSLPKISYLTYMDRYVLATMTCLTMVCIYHGIQTLFPKENFPDKDYYALVILGGLYLTYNIQFMIRLYLVPFQKRRDMINEEREYSIKVREQAELRASSRMSETQPLLTTRPPTRL